MAEKRTPRLFEKCAVEADYGLHPAVQRSWSEGGDLERSSDDLAASQLRRGRHGKHSDRPTAWAVSRRVPSSPALPHYSPVAHRARRRDARESREATHERIADEILQMLQPARAHVQQ